MLAEFLKSLFRPLWLRVVWDLGWVVWMAWWAVLAPTVWLSGLFWALAQGLLAVIVLDIIRYVRKRRS